MPAAVPSDVQRAHLAGDELEQALILCSEGVCALVLDVEVPTTRSPAITGTISSEPVDSSAVRLRGSCATSFETTVSRVLIAAAVKAIPEQELEPTAELLRTAMAGLAVWWIDHPEVPRGARRARHANDPRVLQLAQDGDRRYSS